MNRRHPSPDDTSLHPPQPPRQQQEPRRATLPQEADGTLRNPVEFREWWKIVWRVWRPALTPTELAVVLFIFDRTAGWGKEWEVVPVRHLIEGVKGKDGRMFATGLNLSRSSVMRALASLRSFGALLCRPASKGKNAYSLNYAWEPTRFAIDIQQALTDETIMGLPEPKGGHRSGKKFANRAIEEARGVSRTTPCGVSRMTHRKQENIKCSAETESSLRDDGCAGESLAERALSAMNKTRERREAKKRRLTPEGLVKVWADACRLSHPDQPAVTATNADAAILARYARRFIAANPSTPFREFAEWVIERWGAIREVEFAWMGGSSPSSPSIRFLVKFSDRFEQQWVRRDSLARRATMTERERAVAKRKDKGLTSDEAEGVIAEVEKTKEERRALAAQHDAMNRERRKLERQRLDDAASRADTPAVRSRIAPRSGETPQTTPATFDRWVD